MPRVHLCTMYSNEYKGVQCSSREAFIGNKVAVSLNWNWPRRFQLIRRREDYATEQARLLRCKNKQTIKTQTKPTAALVWSVGLHIGIRMTWTEQNGMLIVFEQAFKNFISLPVDDGQIKRRHVSLRNLHFRAAAEGYLPVPSSRNPRP